MFASLFLFTFHMHFVLQFFSDKKGIVTHSFCITFTITYYTTVAHT